MKCQFCGAEWQSNELACPRCGVNAYTMQTGSEMYENGITAEKEKNYADALKFYTEAADLGAVGAAYAVFCVMKKMGTKEKDTVLLDFWLTVAAENDATAAYSFFRAHRKDNPESAGVALFRAAELGSDDAKFALALRCVRQWKIPAARSLLSGLQSRRAKVLLFLLGKIGRQEKPEAPANPEHGCRLFSLARSAQKLSQSHLAYRLFLAAADEGYAPAYRTLGEMHLTGQGAEKDLKSAVSWFERAAEAGDVTVWLRLEEAYSDGTATGTPDNETAVLYCERAVALGNTDAMRKLAEHRLSGEGIERDPREAIALYDKAAGLGDTKAVECAKIVRAHGDDLFREAEDSYRAGDYEKTHELLNEALLFESRDAMRFLGDLYLAGKGCEKSNRRAADCYRAAFEKKDAVAAYRLGSLYLSNYAVPYDERLAEKLFRFALAGGYVKAKEKIEEIAEIRRRRLGKKLYSISCSVYRRGDAALAAEYRRAASKLGNARATYLLACMYDCGDGVERDALKSRDYFDAAEKLGFDGRKNGFYGKYLRNIPR